MEADSGKHSTLNGQRIVLAMKFAAQIVKTAGSYVLPAVKPRPNFSWKSRGELFYQGYVNR
jgi:hypothetical protein